MSGIEEITKQTVKVDIKDNNGHVIRTKKVLVWNPTVANLSLMALGSSAPEILLAVIETVSTLGDCPGELGASTIVGSAAFNLLVISGLSVYAVSVDNDTDPTRDYVNGPPKGVKKIYDMGVFSITSFFSIWAYVWLFIVLADQNVEIWEAWVTFGSFIFLVIICYMADRYKAAQEEAKRKPGEADAEIFEYNAMEIYKTLIAEKSGNKDETPEGIAKAQKMKGFLKQTVGTDQIDQVDLDQLKENIGGNGMLQRLKYRRDVQNAFSGKRPAIAKGEVIKQEHAHAEYIEDKFKNPMYGFNCLHYSVSEASGSLQVMILNKTG